MFGFLGAALSCPSFALPLSAPAFESTHRNDRDDSDQKEEHRGDQRDRHRNPLSPWINLSLVIAARVLRSPTMNWMW
jgi:hypothetical protein